MAELIARLTTLFDKIDRFSDAKLNPLYSEAVAALIQQRAYDAICAIVFALLSYIAGITLSIVAMKLYRREDVDFAVAIVICVVFAVITLLTALCMTWDAAHAVGNWYQAAHYPNVTLLRDLRSHR